MLALLYEYEIPTAGSCVFFTWHILQVFDAGVVLADGEFSELESAVIGAPLEMTNNYMRAVAYNEVRVANLLF